ncbi:MAG: DUF3794 domain-containing protein [Oscillospiraceae bacterium]|jgi:hypothetical protein|nr:DUF3794 domain-containing protein [Oscillospiraceae bacterium]
MVYNFSRERLNYSELLHRSNAAAEVSQDAIVPDALPDALRVIHAEPEVFIRSKEPQDGKAVVSGVVRAAALYAPEDGGAARRVSLETPFTLAVSDPKITSSSKLVARVWLDDADANIVNPRKLSFRAVVAGTISAYGDAVADVPTNSGLEDAPGIELLNANAELILPGEVREKTFTVTDTVAVPPSANSLREILTSRVTLVPEETRVVGSKLVFKGTAHTDLLYLTDDGKTDALSFASEFSQIAELDSANADGEFEIIPFVAGAYVDAAAENDAKKLNIEIHAVGQIVATTKYSLPYASDAYGTAFAAEPVCEPKTFAAVSAPQTYQTVLRGCLTAERVARVISLSARSSAAEVTRSGGETAVKTRITVGAVYSDTDGGLRSVSQKFEAVCPIKLDSDGEYTATASSGRDLYGVAADGGVEIRVPVEIRVAGAGLTTYSPVSSVSVDENGARPADSRPSVILARARPDDTLWSVAKRYGTTRGIVRETNAIEDGAELAGAMLIIPKSR